MDEMKTYRERGKQLCVAKMGIKIVFLDVGGRYIFG